MGQKINPVALRTKVLGHKSKGWYASFKCKSINTYASKLHLDYLIRQHILMLTKDIDVVKTQIDINQSLVLVTVNVPYPDYLYYNLNRRYHRTIKQTFSLDNNIALKTALQKIIMWHLDLQQDLNKQPFFVSHKYQLSVRLKLVKTPYHHPNFIAQAVETSLLKRVSFRRAMKIWSKIALNHRIASQQVKGLRIKISGRINGAEMASSEQLSIGKVSLHTLSTPVDYCCRHVNTPSGTLGIKVWVAGY